MILLLKNGDVRWGGGVAVPLNAYRDELIKEVDKLTLRDLLTKGRFLTLVQAIVPKECGQL